MHICLTRSIWATHISPYEYYISEWGGKQGRKQARRRKCEKACKKKEKETKIKSQEMAK